MNLIIAGSRSITEEDIILQGFSDSPYNWDTVETVINGDATGVDTIVQSIIENNSYDVKLEKYPANDYIDEAPRPSLAPIIRNTKMAEQADALLAIWDGESNGTEDMIRTAKRKGLQVYIHRTDVSQLSDFE